jgi:hypothetical protein
MPTHGKPWKRDGRLGPLIWAQSPAPQSETSPDLIDAALDPSPTSH